MSTISNLHRPTSIWWPEDRIKSILNPKYIISRLQPQNIPRLFELPEWGEGLTSETYMEWILTKAARLFLILDAIRIPDRIFALVDESCDDDDLPIPEHSVDRLCLSPDGDDISLDTKFFDTQWRFLVRGIAQGDHLVYTQDEDVPIESVRTITGRSLHGRADAVDRVIMAGSVCRVYMRTQVQIGGAPHFFSSDEVLTELRNLKTLSHEHLVSVYASYLKNDCVSVLFTGAADTSLHSFLTDEPMSFKRLAKEQRRRILISWPHCLASAVSWLHEHGHAHGAIRPSNILVNADFHICLGQFQALDSLLSPPQVNDLDAYNYSAPERWTQPPVSVPVPVQQKHPQSQSQSRTILPSGGRSKRRQRPPRLTLAPLNEIPLSSPDHPRPDSSTSKGTVIRIGQPGSPSRYSFAFSSSSSSSGISSTSSIHNHPLNPKHKRISDFWPRKSRSIQTPSIISSSTSSSTSSSSSSSTSSSTSTSISISTSLSDIFSLAATSLDILTILHKKSISAFTAHRAARNRLPGRGGGVADASFHLTRNAVQVQSWIALLEGEAQKRCRRERCGDGVFAAVPRMLHVVRAMLDAVPGERPTAMRVERGFREAVLRGGDGEGEGILHCFRERVGEKRKGRYKKGEREGEIGRVTDLPLASSVVSLESATEFDFGFEETVSVSRSECNVDSDESHDYEYGRREVEACKFGIKSEISPQLRLPELDMNITRIEGLEFDY